MVRPAIRHLASALSLPPSFLDPLRDHVLVGSGLPAQLRYLTHERLIEFSHGRALEDPGDLGQRLLGPAARELAEPGHSGAFLVRGELAPLRVMPRLTGNSQLCRNRSRRSAATDLAHGDGDRPVLGDGRCGVDRSMASAWAADGPRSNSVATTLTSSLWVSPARWVFSTYWATMRST
jgi:hypothetical protein